MNPSTSPLIIDMVHHNPGEPPFSTRFSDPSHLARYGFNSQAFKHLNTVVTFRAIEPSLFPSNDEETRWFEPFRAARKEEIAKARAAGLKVFYHIDLFVLPKPVIARFGDELRDPATGRISIRREATRALHRAMFEEIFSDFPEVDGLIIRVGETYLYDTPHHAGNGAVSYAQGTTPGAQIPEFIELISFLREEICLRHGRLLIHRTWDTKPDRFHADPAFYLAVTDRIEPHPLLLFSIKHTSLDFFRWTQFNPCLGLGRHRQVVEIQCQREYEGKGAFPNYVARGVIEGFPEQRTPRGLAALLPGENFAGAYIWSRGGGWYGPYIQNELWCDLNAWVLAQFVRGGGAQSEEELFFRYCSEVLGADADDARILRRIALLSERAVLAGRYCAAFDRREKPRDLIPTCLWMRDDCLGGAEQLRELIEYLRGHSLVEEALAEKVECVALWREMLKLAESLSPGAPHREFVLASCRYGLLLFDAIHAGWRALIAAPDAAAASAALGKLDEFTAFAQSGESPATPFYDTYWAWPGNPRTPGIGESLRRLQALR